MKIESHIGMIPENEDRIFTFLSDFKNIEPLIPKENLDSWEFHKDSCKLGIGGIGEIELKVLEREPYNLIKLGSGNDSAYAFTLWIQLKHAAEKDTRVRLTLKADLNPLLQLMAKNPLQKFVDSLVDRMGTIQYS
ncbi:MAG: SRPBCC family protein [Bacteroidales bacterium]|nr:SRPBCC family protein [Bacteroidales bacterium]